MKSIIAIFIALALAILAIQSTEARCKRHDRHCCRRPISYGGCHKHVRRWAYNVTCGKCVSFDWSGCGGYDNNFELFDDCNDCCRGTHSCARFRLDRPPHGCSYRWHDGPDHCPRPRLSCHLREHHSHCRHDSCRVGHRCIPHHHRCDHGHHCPQFRCITDPCYSIHRHLGHCERCVAIRAPSCHHEPCHYIAHRENTCHHHHRPIFRHLHHGHHFGEYGHHHGHHFPIVIHGGHHHGHHGGYHHGHHGHHHCGGHHFPCRRGWNSCEHRRCNRYPSARCIVDPCDCRKHWWHVEEHHGRRYFDHDCY